MAQFFAIHPDNPQERLVKQAADIIRNGGVVVYPTDSCYALGCKLGDKAAMERILAIRKIDLKHHLTLMCADLSELGTYAKVDNASHHALNCIANRHLLEPLRQTFFYRLFLRKDKFVCLTISVQDSHLNVFIYQSIKTLQNLVLIA